MATKPIIAYFMHESEELAAKTAFNPTASTDSFVLGNLDDAGIASLRQKGLIVNEIGAPSEPDAPPSLAETIKPKLRLALHKTVFASATRAMATASFDMTPYASIFADLAHEPPLGFPLSTPSAKDEPSRQPLDFYKVALAGPLLEDWRAQIATAGVTLLARDEDGLYTARLTFAQVAMLRALPFITSIHWITPEAAAPSVETAAAAPIPGGGLRMLTYDVVLNLTSDMPTVQDWLVQNHVNISGIGSAKIRIFLIEGSPLVDELRAMKEVCKVGLYFEPVLLTDFSRRILGIETAAAPPIPMVTQDGSGQIVAVADTGIDQTHPDFAGRITAIPRGRAGDASDPNGHGTHVCGCIAGDGTASAGLYRGMAPKATLVVQSLLDAGGGLGGLPVDLNALFQEAYDQGARIHNNSWGDYRIPSEYTIMSDEVDTFVRAHPDMLVVISAGNSGSSANPVHSDVGFVDWLSMNVPATSKNALTVGASQSNRTNSTQSSMTWGQWNALSYPAPPLSAMKISGDATAIAAFSSRGPTLDHRIKPDLVAPGTQIASTLSSTAPIANFGGAVTGNQHYAFDSGTSMSAPLVAGCAALVRQYFMDARKHSPSAALLKATLINSTTWLIGTTSEAPMVGRPNFHQGHGLVNLAAAIPSSDDPAISGMKLQFVDDWQTPATAFRATGQRRRYVFILASPAPDLRFCLAYTDYPGRGLQSCVNLIVQNVDTGIKYIGNAKVPGAIILPDPDNNVESVRIIDAPAGNYMIQISAANLLRTPQDFALVATGFNLPRLNLI